MRILNLFLIGITLLFSACNVEPQEIVKIAMFPCSTYSESYLVTIYDNSTMLVEFGTRYSDDINDNGFIINTQKNENTKLSDNDYKYIITLAQKCFNEENFVSYPDEYVDDGWTIQIKYDNKCITQHTFHRFITDETEAFITELISLSPIDINLHSWS